MVKPVYLGRSVVDFELVDDTGADLALGADCAF